MIRKILEIGLGIATTLFGGLVFYVITLDLLDTLEMGVDYYFDTTSEFFMYYTIPFVICVAVIATGLMLIFNERKEIEG